MKIEVIARNIAEGFVRFSVALVICVAAGVVEAHPYEVAEGCPNLSDNSYGHWCNSIQDGGASDGCCQSWLLPPEPDPHTHAPRYVDRQIQNVEGPGICGDDVASFQAAKTAAQAQCELINPAGQWFLKDEVVVGVRRVPSGSCGHGSWGPNSLVYTTLRPTCRLYY